jgi:hypothetical protein
MKKTTTVMTIIAIIAALGLVAATFAGVPQVEAQAGPQGPPATTPPGYGCGNNPSPAFNLCGNPFQ